MIKKLKDHSRAIGLGLTIALAVFVIALGMPFFADPARHLFLFDVGVDSLGALVCAALFFGCMKQSGEGTKTFRALIVFVSACFAINEAMCYTLQVPEQRTLCFVLCLFIKLIDLVMIYCFYKYIERTLSFQGKLAKWTGKILPILLAFQSAVLVSNAFYPVTFYIDATGMYQTTAFALLEDIYLFAASALTAVLIIRSRNRRSQKAAALSFILFPLIEYIATGGQFGNAGQYGTVLLSLIIMYCIIFNEKNRELLSTQSDLSIAAKIQADALPPAAPEFENHPEICLRGSMNTAKEVGGDFYDYFPIDEDRICLLIADVSGKGTPAALFMMTAKTMIKDYALTRSSTAEIFTIVNARLCENNEEGMFATAWIGILDTRTMTLQYTNAGHNYPVILRRGKPCELLEPVHGLFLAGLEFTEYGEDEIVLAPGDRLFLYTDGVTEAHDRTNGLYGTERLLKVLENTKASPGEQVLQSVLAGIDDFAGGAPQFDDITMAVLSIREQER
ncbi:MAG: serine/threonine-protein phosphatase [Lachnospiraceae bacterium]|nr:serine/threonine-protein phosphatase [Lachnospiraceae bacterium]